MNMFSKVLSSYFCLMIFVPLLFLGCPSFNHVSRDKFISSNESDSIEHDTWQWSFVDGNGENGINKDPLKSAQDPQLTVFNSKLYAVWYEINESDVRQIRVALYNNNDSVPSWTFVGTDLFGSSPQLTVFNSKLYLIYEGSGVSVAVYNGNDSSPSWQIVSNSGLNKDIRKNGSHPQLAVHDSKLYAVWMEEYTSINKKNVRVSVYNGDDSFPSWTFVDGNNAYGLNKDINTDAYFPQLTSFNSRLYLIWSEENAPSKIHVKVYNNNDGSPSWSFVEGTGRDCLNKNTAKHGNEPQLTVYNSKLYAIWGELYQWDGGGMSFQAMAAVYNGDDVNPLWSYVDNQDPFGINKNIKGSAFGTQLTVFNSKLYAVWDESNKIMAACYNGNDSAPLWTFVDNGEICLNKDSAEQAESPQLTVFNSKLYATWWEKLTPKQIRVAVYKN